MPALSVLLPVRDAAPWITASVASLTRQTFRDFEIVAVDGGSTDGTLERLRALAAQESRLRVFSLPGHGLPESLAFAFEQSRAPRVARHDADDLSHRERFARQMERLDQQPEIDVLGTRVRLFPAGAFGPGMARWVAWHNALLTHPSMAREALIDSPLAHGTAMMRREALERAGGWTERGWAEDVDLWLRMLAAGARFAKLPRVLYGWRQHPASATRRDRRYSAQRYAELRLAALRSGFLANARAVTVIGVGVSLETWTERLRATGLDTAAFERGRPRPGETLPGPPLLLVFGTASARDRWRRSLEIAGYRELDDFVFIA